MHGRATEAFVPKTGVGSQPGGGEGTARDRG